MIPTSKEDDLLVCCIWKHIKYTQWYFQAKSLFNTYLSVERFDEWISQKHGQITLHT